jgi:hypothetical protein
MPTTPNYALRYPLSTAAADVVLDLQNLATDVDNALGAKDPVGLVTGEAAVWNGTTWARSSVTRLLASSVVGYPWKNADIDPAAAIAYSKLALTGLVVNADIAAAAAIALTKIAGYPNDATKYLRGDGWNTIPAAPTEQVKTASGTYTTPAGCRAILVEALGGGGGGGGAGAGGNGTGAAAAAGGGGGGAYARKLILAPAATYAFTIGAAGGGGAPTPVVGGGGGDTIFGANVVVAKGGSGGPAGGAAYGYSQQYGGQGGVPGTSVGDVTVGGGNGGTGWAMSLGNGSTTRYAVGGQGGGGAVIGSPSGGYGVAGSGGSSTAGAANGYGAGGGGTALIDAGFGNGGAGAAGLIVVIEFY